MELEVVLEEYKYHGLAKEFTKKTMSNTHQELKLLKLYLTEKRAIIEIENITVHDL